MDLCILHSKEQDKIFLQKQVIWIEVETPAPLAAIEVGQFVVVQLSNRQKYKGVVTMTDLTRSEQFTKGKIAVLKK